MPATLYTVVLWELHNINFPFPVSIPGPPTGFVWVVRDVTLRFPTSGGWVQRPNQAGVLVDGQALVFSPAYETVGNVLYEFRDLRQTIGAGNQLTFTALQAGWDTRATGYQLAAG